MQFRQIGALVASLVADLAENKMAETRLSASAQLAARAREEGNHTGGPARVASRSMAAAAKAGQAPVPAAVIELLA